MMCNAILSAGETFEHWCELDVDHVGDHRCGDCADVWNRGPWDDDAPEPHWTFNGSCAACVAERELSYDGV